MVIRQYRTRSQSNSIGLSNGGGPCRPAPVTAPVPRASLLRGLMVAAVVFLTLLVAGQPAAVTSGTGESILIRLQHGAFDPLTEVPPVSPAEDVIAPAVGEQPHIVQFAGPIHQEWKEDVVTRGGRIVDYIPDYAYVVMLTTTDVPRLRSLPFVRWIGYLQPAYRIERGLLSGGQIVTVTISLFPDTSAPTVRAAVQQSGGLVLDGTGGQVIRAVVPTSAVRTMAARPEVAWIAASREPRLWNEVARSIVAVPPVWTSHGLRGQGQTIAIADTGLDVGDLGRLNRDLRDRILAIYALGRPGDWSDPDGHGTHVAGIAVGSGVNSGANPASGAYGMSHAGAAPEARLVFQSVLDEDGYLGGIPADLSVLLRQAYQDGARVHSNSWGVAVADGGRIYDGYAQQMDRYMWQHPDMLIVTAAGNDGQDADGDGIVDLGSVTTPATAKNVLSVGASESVRLTGGFNTGARCSTWGECWPDAFPVQPLAGDALSNNPSGMAAYSSRGPTPDGRLKPDLVAPGTNIVSVRSALTPESNYWAVYDEAYAYLGGTSMSAPLVAGAAALVRQYYEDMHKHAASAALVKATLLAGAVDMTPGQYPDVQEVPPAPNNVEGWGRLDLTNALFPVPPRRVAYIDATPGLLTGQSAVYTYTVASSAVSLRIILVWTDYPSSLLAGRNLVNDLDLHVVGPNARPGQADSGQVAVDRLNNVEGVVIDAPEPGVYRITVRGHNVPFGPQPYALVVSGALLERKEPLVAFDQVPGFATAGSSVTVTWSISGGTVITATSLLWDVQSRAGGGPYAHEIPAFTAGARSYRVTFAVPLSGTLYVRARAWVDGVEYRTPERAITIVSAARRMFLPLVLTYPPPAPTPIPSPTTTPAVAIQIVRNGGFEDDAPQSPPWRQFDQADPNGLLVSDFWPRTGRWSAWMGGVYSDYQRLSQTVVVPRQAAYAVLTFHWYMNTEDDEHEPHDILRVRLLNAAGEELVTLLQRDNTSVRGSWVQTRYAWVGNFPYAGQTVVVSFDMETDATRNTNLFIDDVSLVVSPTPIEGSRPGASDVIGK